MTEATSSPFPAFLRDAVEMSRRVGADDTLVVWGGGNTSAKTREPDLHGHPEDILRVKESGSDLKTIRARDFTPLRLADLNRLRSRPPMDDGEMVAALAHCTTDPSAPRPSIETLLHAWLPHRFVVHTHADAILMLTNQSTARETLRRVYGDKIAWVGYRRPGFLLSREAAGAVEAHPGARALVMDKHGLVTWGETAREALDSTREMVQRALDHIRSHGGRRAPFGGASSIALPAARRRQLYTRLAPVLRGALSSHGRVVLRLDDSPDILEFINSRRGAELSRGGPATPDHLLHTKALPLLLEGWDPDGFLRQVERALERYESRVTQRFRTHQKGEKMLDPVPRVVLLPRLGMVTAGRDALHAQIIGDIYHHTISILRGATRLGEYRTLTPREAHEAEYWPLELYKLTLAPPEKELAGRIALVTGAASGIGRACALALARRGAHVAAADRDRRGARETARAIEQAHPGRALALGMDVARESQVRGTFEAILQTWGGLDIVVSNAGIAGAAPLADLGLPEWERSLAVNATGHFLITRESLRILQAQKRGGSLIYIASKNVPAPGRDFGAYSASKAAEAQLCRIAALEGGPYGIRANMVNPDAVFQGSRLWSRGLKAERARAHGVKPGDLEEFYRKRNILRVPVYVEDVAEAVVFLASDKSSKMTGAMLPVDGGVAGAFPR